MKSKRVPTSGPRRGHPDTGPWPPPTLPARARGLKPGWCTGSFSPRLLQPTATERPPRGGAREDPAPWGWETRCTSASCPPGAHSGEGASLPPRSSREPGRGGRGPARGQRVNTPTPPLLTQVNKFLQPEGAGGGGRGLLASDQTAPGHVHFKSRVPTGPTGSCRSGGHRR